MLMTMLALLLVLQKATITTQVRAKTMCVGQIKQAK